MYSKLDERWMSGLAMRPAESGILLSVLETRVFRPMWTVVFLTVALVSLLLTFNIVYDSVYFDAAVIETLVDTMNGTRTADHVASEPLTLNKIHFSETHRHLPQVIIVGVRKCGTRALLEMLFLHPQIRKAAGEVHFFDKDDNYEKGLEWYRKKMPYSIEGQLTLEKSPSYFITPEVPERIHAMNASVKLLLIVREPVTRTISDYTQLRAHAATASSMTSVEGSSRPLQLSRSFEELVMQADGTIDESYRPIAISLYHNYMYRWLEVFPRDQILIVNGDQLIEDPVPQIRRIETFLGIEARIGRHNFYFNHTKGFFCLRNETSERCLRESKGRRHPRVSSVVITKLRKFFNDHNQRFYELVGDDLGWPEK